ncbi:hypothetical protein H072_918 [Dactylellina haptotyla CBS 200.50]|uniref:Microbial-type PARG catalytic domain-containing protein n=1 Tax=Dactylellina haptotyla (strain CBS 200.50) TaxID=1284197 RepID=S8AQF1_DACHA|nr:hypothetical protein H072_918 [Dactylellina haptotyla CBS 200.50]
MDQNTTDLSSGSSRGGHSRGGHHGYHSNAGYNANNAESSSSHHGGHGGGRGGRGRGRVRGGRGGFMSPAKAERARLAKETINVTIPHILAHNNRAQNGVDSARRYAPSEISALPKTRSTYIPKLSVINSDTFAAAEDVISHLKTTRAAEYNSGKLRVAVLNMASNVQPGGGVLNGSQAQEETLCRRSTLYPSLANRPLHPLAPGMIIYTKDVLVFMDQQYQMLPEAERYWVDVISAAAPKRPDLTSNKEYADQNDLEALILTIKNMMRMAVMKGATHLVLGAFGCGAYGNPNKLVAEHFKRVICGRSFGVRGSTWEREEREVWSAIEEVVFAIYGEDRGKGNLDAFQAKFAQVEKWQDRKASEDEYVLVEASGSGTRADDAEGEDKA